MRGRKDAMTVFGKLRPMPRPLSDPLVLALDKMTLEELALLTIALERLRKEKSGEQVNT